MRSAENHLRRPPLGATTIGEVSAETRNPAKEIGVKLGKNHLNFALLYYRGNYVPKVKKNSTSFAKGLANNCLNFALL